MKNSHFSVNIGFNVRFCKVLYCETNIHTNSATAISPQFWGHLLRIKPMFNRSKTRLITSVQNRTHLTHLNFGVSTSAHNCAHLYSAQNCAQQNYGVNITQPKSWLSTSPFWWSKIRLRNSNTYPNIPCWQAVRNEVIL